MVISDFSSIMEWKERGAHMRKLWMAAIIFTMGLWQCHAITPEMVVKNTEQFQSIDVEAGQNLYWNSYAVQSVLYNPPMYGISSTVYEWQYVKNTVKEEKITFYYNLVSKTELAYAITERTIYDSQGRILKEEGEEPVRMVAKGDPLFTVADLAFKRVYGSLYSEL